MNNYNEEIKRNIRGIQNAGTKMEEARDAFLKFSKAVGKIPWLIRVKLLFK